LSTISSRAFPVAATKIWNALPDNVISAASGSTENYLSSSDRSAVRTLVVGLAVVLTTYAT